MSHFRFEFKLVINFKEIIDFIYWQINKKITGKPQLIINI